MSEVPCRLLDWDTAFWGLPVARVEGSVLTEERCAAVDDWCRDHDIACAYFLATCDEHQTTFIAEKGGFFYTDVRVTLRLKLATRPAGNAGVRIRAARPDDADEICAIARVSHKITRFYHDPNFPDERCGDLYAGWIAADLDGDADAVLVAEIDGRAAGYLSLNLGSDGVGGVSLLGVAPASRGIGLGGELLAAGLDRFAAAGMTESVLATQGQNISALRLFGRAGYAVDSMHIWFHKWYDR